MAQSSDKPNSEQSISMASDSDTHGDGGSSAAAANNSSPQRVDVLEVR